MYADAVMTEAVQCKLKDCSDGLEVTKLDLVKWGKWLDTNILGYWYSIKILHFVDKRKLHVYGLKGSE